MIKGLKISENGVNETEAKKIPMKRFAVNDYIIIIENKMGLTSYIYLKGL